MQPLDDNEVRELTLWETDAEIPAFRQGWLYFREHGEPPEYFDPTGGAWGQNERVAFGRGALACKAVRAALVEG